MKAYVGTPGQLRRVLEEKLEMMDSEDDDVTASRVTVNRAAVQPSVQVRMQKFAAFCWTLAHSYAYSETHFYWCLSAMA